MKITGYRKSGGTGRRKFRLAILDNHSAEGWLEDDFHHFGVVIQHHDNIITDVTMTAARVPWSACPGAAEPLKALIGKPLVSRCADIGTLIDMRLQCTHVFDLTGLLIAHIANQHTRPSVYVYHVEIPDRPLTGEEYQLASFGPGTAKLTLNDLTVMTWQIDGEYIKAPAPFRNISLDRGFRSWTDNLPLPEAEYANILRRAIVVTAARAINSDDYPTASAMAHKTLCHTFQPGRMEIATRHFGNVKDYSEHPEQMLRFVDPENTDNS